MPDNFAALAEEEKIKLLKQQQQRIQQLEAELSRQITDWSPLSADDFLRDILDTLPLILFATDTDGNILFTRGSGLNSLNVEADRSTGKNIFELYAREPELIGYVKKALKGKRLNGIQVEVRGISYQAYYFPLHDSAREIIGMTAIITSIDVLKRTEQALRDSERLLRAIFDTSSHLIVLIDVEGFLLDVNQTAMQLTRVSYEQTIGTRLWELPIIKDNSVRHRLRDSVELAKRGQQTTMEFELHDQVRDKMITVDFSLQPVYDDEDNVHILLAEGRDITGRKKVEEAINRAFRRERELSDLKSRFITTTSHEFRTPLAIISSSSFLLKQYYDRLSDDKRNQHFNKIQNNVEHIAAMLDDILLLGQLQSRTWETAIEQMNFSDLVYNIVQYFRTRYVDTHIIELTMPSDPVYYDGDERLLNQVLMNLLRNAIIFSPGGGSIIVELQTAQNALVLRVQDDGIGIPKNEQPKLFDVFYRGSQAENIPGRGLGLTIVRDVLHLHQGHITVESEPEHGSTFTVRLPMITSA